MSALRNDPQYDRYIQDITRHPLLTREEEHALAVAARAGDKDAARRLVECNLRFVVKIALQYRRYGLRVIDLIQEGNLGLMRAVEKFDPERGHRLVTYAVHWIRASIREYILKDWSMVRVGTTHAERRLFFRLPRARRELPPELLDDPQETLAALASALYATEAQVERATSRIYGRDQSMALPIGGEDGSLTLGETFASDLDGPDDQVADDDLRQRVQAAVAQAMEALPEREQRIARARLLTDQRTTLADLGEELALSRERIRQLEVKAVAAMGNWIRKHAPEVAELASAGLV